MKILLLYTTLLVCKVFSKNITSNVKLSNIDYNNEDSENIKELVDLEELRVEALNTVVTDDKETSNTTSEPFVFNNPKLKLNENVTDLYERMLVSIRSIKSKTVLSDFLLSDILVKSIKNKAVINESSVSDILTSSEFLRAWGIYKKVNKKSYRNDRIETLRKLVFLINLNTIEEHNIKYDEGLVTYRLGVNEYADMVYDEFMMYKTGLKFKKGLENILKKLRGNKFTTSRFIPPKFVNVPESFDWRDEGAVTEVKNQESCGSCWAFSSTGSLEGQLFRKKKKLIPLSEQNLVDCSTSFGNAGCNGGLMVSAFKYMNSKGINSEANYPYTGKSDKCRYKPLRRAARVTGVMEIEPGNESDLKLATATAGPISVAIDASLPTFQFYKSGVMNDNACSKFKLNHAVLVVGYGTDSVGGDYWLVKNSWGSGWGDNGYIKMARNKSGHCGIAQMASYPLT